ncbi:MAG: uracil-DNA glycosylase [Terriglobales bacterium]|jgi:DNA polymerase
MPKRTLDAKMRTALAARIDYYRDLGIHDFYRREVPESPASDPELALTAGEPSGQELMAEAAVEGADPVTWLREIRQDLGDCTRCPLHTMGRKQIVFGTGDPHAELMFVGEAPGADEDQRGEPFVGRAGQLLNNMITAMGLGREDVYIANVIKCRPPGNRTPLPEECATCSPFLLRQIDAIHPKALVALGAVAARTLLGVNDSMGSLRGHWYQVRGIALAVTYHPAYLLRNPPAKKDTWQDLQMVMKRLGLEAPKKSSP